MSIWVFSARITSLRQFDRALDSIEEVLKRNYHSILQEAEIDSALNPVRISNRKYLIVQSRHYVLIWLLIVGLLIAGFVLGNVLFVKAPAANSSTTSFTPPPELVQSTEEKKPTTAPVSIEKKHESVRSGPGNPLDRRVDLRHIEPH
ncbi:hypothetical protein D9M71_560670 [compost metagenome]